MHYPRVLPNMQLTSAPGKGLTTTRTTKPDNATLRKVTAVVISTPLNLELLREKQRLRSNIYLVNRGVEE